MEHKRAPLRDAPSSIDSGQDVKPDQSSENAEIVAVACWYRSTLFNIFLVGVISLTQAGLWAALNSEPSHSPCYTSDADFTADTGAGGQQKPYLVIGSTAIIFGVMTIGCPITAVLINRVGPKPMLIVSTLGLAPYSASLYLNNRYGLEWYVLFSAVLVGVSGAAAWTTETTVAITYAPLHQMGRYIAICLGLRELGQILGAAIALSVNHSTDHLGKVSYKTYLIFIGIECLGLPLALLFSSPRRALRPDGMTVASAARHQRARLSLDDTWSVLQQKWMLLLIPVSICFQWNNAYQSIYLASYFTVRTRALASLVSGVVVTIADFGTGMFLDSKRLDRPTKAKCVVVSFSLFMVSLLAWQISNEYKYSEDPSTSIDWTSKEFGRAFAVHILLRFFNEAHIVCVFWFVGAFTSDPRAIASGCGLVNGFEALGSTISNAIGSSARIAPRVDLWIAFALFTASIAPTVRAAWMVPEMPRSNDKMHDRGRESELGQDRGKCGG
jgi:hypothetical protein